jgi:hypothetical protein
MSLRPDPAQGMPTKDWTIQATDVIDQAVGLVRDRATVPVRTAARAVVYGIALGVVAVVAVTLAVVGSIRFVIAYLPVGTAPNGAPRVWVAYVLIGGMLTILALFVLRRAEHIARENE